MAKQLAHPQLIRCAVYTRKSTEEGLEQDFNSLHAQREACEAYIVSQKHEGWVLAPGEYDDGGFSGGTMDRPALKRLLDEVRAGTVDVIVVYKVDRLTRNLGDFARIVDVLDAAKACFVSVTQAFNTTSSMGRLTLNVLLSFAQFEREVTGERIRDKIAASKAKGMWMGGPVPLGYVVCDRKLVVDEPEAATVRLIFKRFLELGSMLALQAELEGQGVRSKVRVSTAGNTYGGAVLSRGALYGLLQNRTYVGEISHKGVIHTGEHQAIVDREVFDAVQARLAANRGSKGDGGAQHPSLLTGLAWDQHGRKFSPTHTTKGAKRYRYYLAISESGSNAHPQCRVPAGDLEELVVKRVKSFLANANAVADAIAGFEPSGAVAEKAIVSAASLSADLEKALAPAARLRLLQLIERVEVHAERVDVHLRRSQLIAGAASATAPVVLTSAAKLVRGPKEVQLVIEGPASEAAPRRDASLIKLIVKAYAARTAVEKREADSIHEIAAAHGCSLHEFRKLVRIGYLSPSIVTAIVEGRQPAALTRNKLARMTELPLDWDAQAAKLGFAAAL